MTAAMAPKKRAATIHNAHFLRACATADTINRTVTVVSGESHRHGNSTKRSSGRDRYKIMLGGNIMKVDTAPRAVSNSQMSGASRRNRRASTVAMTATMTRKRAMNDRLLLKARYRGILFRL